MTLRTVTLYELKLNRAGKWFYREIRGGKNMARSAPYYSKWNAKRAVIARVKGTKNVWRFFEVPTVYHQDADFR